jgi:hypothetical protein
LVSRTSDGGRKFKSDKRNYVRGRKCTNSKLFNHENFIRAKFFNVFVQYLAISLLVKFLKSSHSEHEMIYVVCAVVCNKMFWFSDLSRVNECYTQHSTLSA